MRKERQMEKVYENESWLREKLAQGENSRSLSKQLHVSYKLIEIYLEKYAIPYVPGQINL